MSPTEVQTFFEIYREAFNRLDGDAVADLWHAGSGITDSRGQGDASGPCARLTWWPEDAPMRANHRALCELYRSQDYGRADFTIDHVQPLGPAHAFVNVQWTLQRRDGIRLQQFGTGYQLMRTAQGPRVLLAVAYQEDLRR